jgi:hypothetical protein
MHVLKNTLSLRFNKEKVRMKRYSIKFSRLFSRLAQT